MIVNILAVGDISGSAGLRFLGKKLRELKQASDISFTVVNGENCAQNIAGLTPADADAIFAAGADVITLGNHTWGKKEIRNYLDDNTAILRPANFATQCPGRGFAVFETTFGLVRVINLIGVALMSTGADNPMHAADKILRGGNGENADITLIDFHAEATAEKAALARYLDGRVSAVWGTHTHVQTSDAQILKEGTGFVTDIGMTGAIDSILGVKPELSISRMLGNPPEPYMAAEGRCKLECAVITVDSESGRCENVKTMRICE